MLGGINNGLFLTSFGGFFAVGILSLILIWAFKRGKSVVQRTPKVGGENDYGALVVIASPNNYIEGELMRLKHGNSGDQSQSSPHQRLGHDFMSLNATNRLPAQF